MTDSDFFGRTGELETLQDAYESTTAEMAIIYGRRRVGKTALIRKFCEGKPLFFYTAKAWKDDFQLEAFSQAVGAVRRNPQQRFLDWPAALRALTDQPCDARRVIVIDEFQHIAKERPSILSELQVLWDEELSRKNIFLILCGSAVSFIAKEVLGEKNPLYGRARTIMKVRPLPFHVTAQFVPDCTADEVFRGYAVLGGIPYFWQGLSPKRSMTENLATNLLRENGFLNDEAQSVLRQEFRDPSTYNAILQAIAFGATTRHEIAQKSLADSRNLTKYLTVLEDMGFIEREFSVFAGAGELSNASRGLYRIADHYLKFWFRFLATNPGTKPCRNGAHRLSLSFPSLLPKRSRKFAGNTWWASDVPGNFRSDRPCWGVGGKRMPRSTSWPPIMIAVTVWSGNASIGMRKWV